VNDLHIAAHARSEGLVLVTNNLREFDRVPGLPLENWFGQVVLDCCERERREGLVLRRTRQFARTWPARTK